MKLEVREVGTVLVAMLQKLLRRAQGLHDKRANAFHRDHILDNEDLVKPASYA